MNLLIIDDDPAICQMLARILPVDGYTVLSVPNGSAALEKLENENIDVVLLDYHLEDMTAEGVLDRMNELGSSIPVLIMSGMSDEEIQQGLLQQGARAVIEKPFDLIEIRNLLKKTLDLRR